MTMATSLKLKCKNLESYLKTLSDVELDKLYNHPASCLAVFRQLPDLAKHFVMRLLFFDQDIYQHGVKTWITQNYFDEYDKAIQTLNQLRIWHDQAFNDIFKKNMRAVLLGGGVPWSVRPINQPGADKHSKDMNFLDNYARERWESVLCYLAGYGSRTDVSKFVIQIILSSKLMSTDSSDDYSSLTITSSGFQFLLMDTASQVWFFILHYLETIEERNMESVECLSFIFQLSFSTLGKDYSTEGLSENLMRFLQHLREIGLVFQRKRKSKRFYPTFLVINLASGLANLKTDKEKEGYLIVETNYRVNAYTDSTLKLAVLGLFCEIYARFTGCAFAYITRESVRQALVRGITAEQIIVFLRSNAHSEVFKRSIIIPPTVSDQIRLWELERDRFKFNEGVLYNQFSSLQDFEVLRNHAVDLGVLIWDNPDKKLMVISQDGHDEVKKFWKKKKHNQKENGKKIS